MWGTRLPAVSSNCTLYACVLCPLPPPSNRPTPRPPHDHHPLLACNQEVQLQLQTLLEAALADPRSLLTGAHAASFRQLLQRLPPMHAAAAGGGGGRLPWQLLVIHTRLEGAIDAAPYEELHALFGGPVTAKPVSEALLRRLPVLKPSKRQMAAGLGAAAACCCPICLQVAGGPHGWQTGRIAQIAWSGALSWWPPCRAPCQPAQAVVLPLQVHFTQLLLAILTHRLVCAAAAAGLEPPGDCLHAPRLRARLPHRVCGHMAAPAR